MTEHLVSARDINNRMIPKIPTKCIKKGWSATVKHVTLLFILHPECKRCEVHITEHHTVYYACGLGRAELTTTFEDQGWKVSLLTDPLEPSIVRIDPTYAPDPRAV